jgi:type I restriction enzyme S subunit
MFKSQIFRRFVNSLNTGSLIQHMFTSQLSEFELPLPPLAEQHRIVAEVERRLSIIEEIEAVINANMKRAERMRQAILKRAFEGKLVAQDPSDEPASVLLERIRAERADGAAKKGREPRRRRSKSGANAEAATLPLIDRLSP